MVWFATHYRHGTVKLFDEDEADHLVGKGHLAERELFVCLGIDIGGESVRTTYDEYKALADHLHLAFHVTGKLNAAVLLAMLVKEHDMVTWLQLLKNQFAFLLFLLLGREVLGVL